MSLADSEYATEEPQDLREGEVFDYRYRMVRRLGVGGMGAVWLAEHLERNSTFVALKFLRPELSARADLFRFLKEELETTFALTHHHIVRTYRLAQADGKVAIEMEYMDGGSLADYLEREPAQCLAPTKLRPWAQQICSALAYAHKTAKIIHLDLKPLNFLLNQRGELKVSDFGIAAPIVSTLSQLGTYQSGRRNPGTPPYMSPQQLCGAGPVSADDIYSLGVSLYQLLTGSLPFRSSQPRSEPPPPVSRRREERGRSSGLEFEPIPQPWEETIAACLAEKTEDRPDLQKISLCFDPVAIVKQEPPDRSAKQTPAREKRAKPQPAGGAGGNIINVGRDVKGDVTANHHVYYSREEAEE